MVSLVIAAADARKPKEQALILLMRYSGLSIRDAVTCRQDFIHKNTLTLRRAKSGELVMVPLHSLAVEALERIARPNQTHFFWSGSSQPVTMMNYWRARLYLVADKASINNFRPHRLRDTFAVEALLAGVPIQDVSTLLGHSSVSTTERYYAPWNVSRRDRLVRIMREVHACDPLLGAFSIASSRLSEGIRLRFSECSAARRRNRLCPIVSCSSSSRAQVRQSRQSPYPSGRDT